MSLLYFFLLLPSSEIAAGETDPPHADYAAAAAVFSRYCTGCHNPDELDGDLDLTTHAAILAGNDDGPVVVPGKPDESRLVLAVEHKLKPFMPPAKERPPAAAEVAVLRAWVESGAPGPAAGEAEALLVAPRIEPTAPPRLAVNDVAASPDGRLLAFAVSGEVRLLDTATREPLGALGGVPGRVNALAFSADGSLLAAAAGEPGLSGAAAVFRIGGGAGGAGEAVRSFRGQRDAIHAVALSADGRVLATGSYDQTIVLWDIERGERLGVLEGHNGAVFDLAFRPDGRVLASASADRTVKLWSVERGERLDTLSESRKELHAVAFSPDGARVAAGGADNRIRVWRVSAAAAEGTNPLLHSRFAHEGAILDLAFSPDGATVASSAVDGTVKLWKARELEERALLELQPDWPAGLAFASGGRALVVGRLDGSIGFYDVATGREVRVASRPHVRRRTGLLVSFPPEEAAATGTEEKPPPKPELARIEPRGIARGATARLRISGKHLDGLTDVRSHHEGLRATLVSDPPAAESSAWIEVSTRPDLAAGPYELSVVSPAGESGRARLFVDTLQQLEEREPNDGAGAAVAAPLPAGVWGVIDRAGDVDHVAFEARAGETVVLDVAARRLGSKADLVLSVLDGSGRVLETVNDFDGDLDPLLAFTAPADGRYVARVADLALGASKEHFWRLSAGAFPFVTACFPLGVPAGKESRVELAGYNLPPDAAVTVSPGAGAGEADVPIDPERYRTRRGFRVTVVEGDARVESEPNDSPAEADEITCPGSAGGKIAAPPGSSGTDADLYRFATRAGETWIVETEAARRGSPVDTRIEVLHDDGRPVERVLLQAVRDSEVTFRGIDSNTVDVRLTNWEEMELNELLWFQGEVGKIFRMPQGPDSGFNLYRAANGQRFCHFDTSPTVHALHEPVYVVEPHPPGARLVPTGLPVFTLHYANDDDGARALGRDSRLAFTAPADGDYLVRVTDARGFGGDRFAYRLVLRRPRPDFVPSVAGAGPTVSRGSGVRFTCRVDRRDGFDGAVHFDISGLPPGFTVSTPVIVEAGHLEAQGTINAAVDAPAPTDANAAAAKVTATAVIDGEEVVREVGGGLGRFALGGDPPIRVELLPPEGPGEERAGPRTPFEIVIEPGRRARALLRIARLSHIELVTFDVENLPHGVIVDDIGLNGVLIPAGETERVIFLNCAGWVPETSRLCHARSREAGGQTSVPVMLRVRQGGE